MDGVSKTHVGLDVHAKTIAVGVAEPGRGTARVVGTIVHDVKTLLKALKWIGSAGSLHLAYEAGPTGFGLQRAASGQGPPL